MDERELIGAAQGGDRSAFEVLVKQTYADTYTLAYRLTGNEEDARDVAQDAYLKAWRGISKFRGDAQFSTWMYRITANASSTYMKKRRRQRTESIDDVGEPAELRYDANPVAQQEAAELLDRLSEAVDALPAKLRQVVVLRDVYGLGHDAIATELDITETAAKVRLHRARRKLREVLDAPGEQQGANAHAM